MSRVLDKPFLKSLDVHTYTGKQYYNTIWKIFIHLAAFKYLP